MSNCRLLTIRSATELLERAVDWNDLWRRSAAALPTNRAEGAAAWLEAFGGDRSFEALVVERGDRFVAALPLLAKNYSPLFQMKRQATNFWSDQGDLLLDEIEPCDDALDCLVAGMSKNPQALYWFNAVPIDSTRWQGIIAATQRAGMTSEQRPVADVGRVEIDHDWPKYMASWSRNHRRHIVRAQKRADSEVGVTLRALRPTEDEVEPLLREGFEIEDRGWKGREGSSVLRTPKMFEFFVRQARLLAEQNMLQLVFLDNRERSIAFEYAPSAKGTYIPLKIAYDEEFAEWAPGQLLRAHLFEKFYGDPEMKCVDFSGTLVDATEKWTTSIYKVARLVVASRGVRSRAMMAAYRQGMPAVRQARQLIRRLRNGNA